MTIQQQIQNLKNFATEDSRELSTRTDMSPSTREWMQGRISGFNMVAKWLEFDVLPTYEENSK